MTASHSVFTANRMRTGEHPGVSQPLRLHEAVSALFGSNTLCLLCVSFASLTPTTQRPVCPNRDVSSFLQPQKSVTRLRKDGRKRREVELDPLSCGAGLVPAEKHRTAFTAPLMWELLGFVLNSQHFISSYKVPFRKFDNAPPVFKLEIQISSLTLNAPLLLLTGLQTR